MIIMKLPEQADGCVPMRRIVLKSGREIRPDRETGRVYVMTQAEANELIADGWEHVATSKVADDIELRKSVAAIEAERAGHKPIHLKAVNTDALLHRAATTEFRHQTGDEPAPIARRITVGEVDTGSPFGRLFVEHDQHTDDVSVSGVNFDLADNADEGLATAFRRATGAFLDAAEDAAEQDTARATIAALTHAILSRNGVVADAVRRQKFKSRFGA